MALSGENDRHADLKRLSAKARRELQKTMANQVAARLASRGITENSVKKEFEQSRNTRPDSR